MPKNKSEDLNNLLFETIEMLRDGEMDVERANAIAKTAQVIVNNTKNELEFMKEAKGIGVGSGFFAPMSREQKLIND